MIRLQVENYCHTCTHFEPCLISIPTNLYADNTLIEVLGDYVVSCENSDLCKDLYLKAKDELSNSMLDKATVPDCNDCGYLNYTEKQQQAYGANSYMKDHRCNCYNRPLYHRANFRKHDSYIYPCEECKEDNFVNYFDCESSKCNKKGE